MQNICKLLVRTSNLLGIMLAGLLLSLAACMSPLGGGPNVPSPPNGPSIPIPLPPIPGGSGGGPSTPKPSLPSPSPKSGSKSDAEAGDETGKKASKGTADKNAAGSKDDELPPEWEDESDTNAGSGIENADTLEEVTFEEPQSEEHGGEFEETSFEEKSGLSEKELEELEKELNETLGDFDEEIDREKTYAEERANDNTGDSALEGEGVFDDYSEDDDGNAKKGQRPLSTTASSSEGTGQSSASGTGGESAGQQGTDRNGNNPEAGAEKNTDKSKGASDIADGRKNDDIVARQIREAAETEKDPELKKKLWEEYRKYKSR